MAEERQPRGFAAMSAEQRRQISSMGGRARGEMYEHERQARQKNADPRSSAPASDSEDAPAAPQDV